jgi:hypothetical protein
LTKDKRLRRRVTTRYSIEQFIALWADQIPDRYHHAVRYFGLLAPGTKSRTWAPLFVLLGQERRPRPPRLGWRNALRQYFGVDPQLDGNGEPTKWVRRKNPCFRVSPRNSFVVISFAARWTATCLCLLFRTLRRMPARLLSFSDDSTSLFGARIRAGVARCGVGSHLRPCSRQIPCVYAGEIDFCFSYTSSK